MSGVAKAAPPTAPNELPIPDHREQPPTLRVCVHVRREAPELSHGHDVEDPDPQEEGQAYAVAARPKEGEHQEVRREEHRHDADETGASDPRRKPSVGHRDEDQQERLTGRGVTFHLGAAGQQNEGLASHLQQVVRREQQEDIQRQQRHGRHLARPDIAEHA